MSERDCINAFSDYLFWDIDKDSLSLENNDSYVVGRVLEFGQLQDWQQLISYYGLDRITTIAKGLRTLDPRALSFISLLSSTPRTTYRCYSKKPFLKAH